MPKREYDDLRGVLKVEHGGTDAKTLPDLAKSLGIKDLKDEVDEHKKDDIRHLTEETMTLINSSTDNSTAINTHVNSNANPHNVTAAQVGAPTQGNLNAHINNVENPHNVTAAQIGAITQAQWQDFIAGIISIDDLDIDTSSLAKSEDLNNHVQDISESWGTDYHNVHISPTDRTTLGLADTHINNVNNPHNVTAAQVGATTTSDFNNHVQDIPEGGWHQGMSDIPYEKIHVSPTDRENWNSAGGLLDINGDGVIPVNRGGTGKTTLTGDNSLRDTIGLGKSSTTLQRYVGGTGCTSLEEIREMLLLDKTTKYTFPSSGETDARGWQWGNSNDFDNTIIKRNGVAEITIMLTISGGNTSSNVPNREWQRLCTIPADYIPLSFPSTMFKMDGALDTIGHLRVRYSSGIAAIEIMLNEGTEYTQTYISMTYMTRYV